MFGRMLFLLALGALSLGLTPPAAVAASGPYDLSPLAETLAQDPQLSKTKPLLIEGKERSSGQSDRRAQALAGALAAALRSEGFKVSTLEENPSGSAKGLVLIALDYEEKGARLLVRVQATDFVGGQQLTQGFAVVPEVEQPPADRQESSAAAPPKQEEDWMQLGLDRSTQEFRVALVEAFLSVNLLDRDTRRTAIYNGLGVAATWLLHDPWAVKFTLGGASATVADNEDENLSQPFSGQCSLYEAAGEYHWHLEPNRRGWDFLLGAGYNYHECVNKLEADGQKVTFTYSGVQLYGEVNYIWQTGVFLGFHMPIGGWASAKTESDEPTNYELKSSFRMGLVFGYAF